MVRNLWQRSMIAAARSPRIKRFMQTSRATSFLADRYVAGKTAADGVARAQALLTEAGIRSSLFYMGEYVDTLERVELNVAQKLAAVAALAPTGLDLHISVDPTQIGHQVDPALVPDRARAIAAAIAAAAAGRPGVNALMFDMEDATVTGPTIALHDELQDAGLPVALTLQAYLRRTEADMAAQIARGSRVRLVRGAFAEGPAIAFTRTAEIKDSYRRLLGLMFSPAARERGFYPVVATHDTALQEVAMAEAARNGWPPDGYEFEMLLGVREDVARALAARGQRVRLYVPFGEDWWPHAVRRIGEYPGNAVLLARSLVS